MGIFDRFRQKWAIRAYARRLGPLLAKRYGRQKFYTADQVRRTIEVCGFSRRYIAYAYAMFLTEHAFAGEKCTVRTEDPYSSLRETAGGIADHRHWDVDGPDFGGSVFEDGSPHDGGFEAFGGGGDGGGGE